MISVNEMKRLEDHSERYGVSKLQLMENAGKGIADFIIDKFEKLDKKKILIVCYHGNNGGDGFVAARYLSEITNVDILFIGDESKLKDEAEKNYFKIQDNLKIGFIFDYELLDFNKYGLMVDSMLGTGIKGPLNDPISTVIDKFNRSKAYKIAVDVPTGIDPDTGKVIDKAVKADITLTFHDLKNGMKNLKTEIIDIGIPKRTIT